MIKFKTSNCVTVWAGTAKIEYQIVCRYFLKMARLIVALKSTSLLGVKPDSFNTFTPPLKTKRSLNNDADMKPVYLHVLTLFDS